MRFMIPLGNGSHSGELSEHSSCLPYGTKEEVRKVTLERLEKCGMKGGIVIGPTHIVEPEVPWENLIAITEAVSEFEGKYSESGQMSFSLADIIVFLIYCAIVAECWNYCLPKGK